MTIEIEPVNTEIDGTSRTIKAQYYKNGVANLDRTDSFGCTGAISIEKVHSIAAMRGRDPQNPSDRAPGNPNLEQRLELNSQGMANTIKTVQKDNIVVEQEKYVSVKQATKDGSIPCVVGGGGGSSLSDIEDTSWESDRRWSHMSDTYHDKYP